MTDEQKSSGRITEAYFCDFSDDHRVTVTRTVGETAWQIVVLRRGKLLAVTPQRNRFEAATPEAAQQTADEAMADVGVDRMGGWLKREPLP